MIFRDIPRQPATRSFILSPCSQLKRLMGTLALPIASRVSPGFPLPRHVHHLQNPNIMLKPHSPDITGETVSQVHWLLADQRGCRISVVSWHCHCTMGQPKLRATVLKFCLRGILIWRCSVFNVVPFGVSAKYTYQMPEPADSFLTEQSYHDNNTYDWVWHHHITRDLIKLQNVRLHLKPSKSEFAAW